MTNVLTFIQIIAYLLVAAYFAVLTNNALPHKKQLLHTAFIEVETQVNYETK
jgi:hypothetical protein